MSHPAGHTKYTFSKNKGGKTVTTVSVILPALKTDTGSKEFVLPSTRKECALVKVEIMNSVVLVIAKVFLYLMKYFKKTKMSKDSILPDDIRCLINRRIEGVKKEDRPKSELYHYIFFKMILLQLLSEDKENLRGLETFFQKLAIFISLNKLKGMEGFIGDPTCTMTICPRDKKIATFNGGNLFQELFPPEKTLTISEELEIVSQVFEGRNHTLILLEFLVSNIPR
jgi:hypothetical protein